MFNPLPLLLLASLASAQSSTTSLPASATITSAPAAATTTAAPVAGAPPAGTPLPLTEYFYPFSAIPYQVNPYQIDRGPQSGYNQCNTTDSPTAKCQTAIVNSISDFCLWGAPGIAPAYETIGDVEAAVVAYCTKAGHGARIFPNGTFTAVQFIKTPAYIQITGLFDQRSMNLAASDSGGELDPHGADLAGNPLGGLVYSNATGFGGGGGGMVQSQSWTNFVGGNVFCIKVCDPSYQTTLNYCENRYDLIGCKYNMPAAYAPGVFESCQGEMQDVVGTYVQNGQTLTWNQPQPTLGPNDVVPYTPRIPATSSCTPFKSADLFPIAQLGYQATALAASTTSSSSATATGSGASTSRTTGGSSSAATASATGAKSGVERGVGWGFAPVVMALGGVGMGLLMV